MAAEISIGPAPARRDALAKRIRLLVAATITYNVVEAIVAITAGAIAPSTALIGFGLDSVIEVSSAAAVAWQFSGRDHAVREAREKTILGSSPSRSSRSPRTSPSTPSCRSLAPERPSGPSPASCSPLCPWP